MQKDHRSLHDEGGRRIWRVPPGRRFVQRDSFGLDSAIIGPIPLRAVQGIVVANLSSIFVFPERDSTSKAEGY